MKNLDELASTLYNTENPFYRENVFRANFISDKLAEKVTGLDVLDLGIGYPFIIKRLAGLAKTYDLVEGSQIHIDKFISEGNLNENMSVSHSYYEEFCTEKKYDCILMNSVLIYIDNPLNLLKKYKEYLNDDGKLVITVQNAEALHRRFGVELGVLGDIHELRQTHIERRHKQYFTLKELENLILSAGYSIDSAEGILLKTITTGQMHELGFTDKHYEAMMKLGEKYPELSNQMFVICSKSSESEI